MELMKLTVRLYFKGIAHSQESCFSAENSGSKLCNYLNWLFWAYICGFPFRKSALHCIWTLSLLYFYELIIHCRSRACVSISLYRRCWNFWLLFLSHNTKGTWVTCGGPQGTLVTFMLEYMTSGTKKKVTSLWKMSWLKCKKGHY